MSSPLSLVFQIMGLARGPSILNVRSTPARWIQTAPVAVVSRIRELEFARLQPRIRYGLERGKRVAGAAPSRRIADQHAMLDELLDVSERGVL